MRILVIGAVAAGTSAAAKARRNNENAEIVIYEKDQWISYSGCGMPYYLGREIRDPEELSPRDPAFFKAKYNIDIKVGFEVTAIDRVAKQIEVKNLADGQTITDHYDKLILATGARPQLPPVPGIDLHHVFALRTLTDMYKIDQFMELYKPHRIFIVGTGYIGLEMAENLANRGLDVTMAEVLNQVAPIFDADLAHLIEEELTANGIHVLTSNGVASISTTHVTLADGQILAADMVIVATGVVPEVSLAKAADLHLGSTGAIKVNSRMQTSDPDIYAAGDSIEQTHLITGKPLYVPLGSTANKTGRICGDQVTGGSLEYRGSLGTGIFRVFDLACATTGLSEKQALAEGFDVEVTYNIKPDHADYLGGKEMTIKAVADRATGRLLGAQIIGPQGVDKRIDVFVTAITFGAKASDLFHLDLAYAPPFSTTKDPVMYTGMILDNAISHGRPLMRAENLHQLQKLAAGVAEAGGGEVSGAGAGGSNEKNTPNPSPKKITVLDVRASKSYESDHVPGALSIPQSELREALPKLPKDHIYVTYCNKGVTGNSAQNVLLNHGFTEVYNLNGGFNTYKLEKEVLQFDAEDSDK